MKITIGCCEDASYKVDVNVYLLHFRRETGTFSMPRPIGDDWLQEITCTLKELPSSISFGIGDTVYMGFKLRADAEAFAAWLVEAEREAQHGYATMRG